MFFLICLTVLQLLKSSYADTPDQSRVAQSFKNHPIVPKIVLNPPSAFISVAYLDVTIDLGTVVFPVQTLGQPQNVSYEADPEKLYTFVFIGPDLPPSVVVPLTQLVHWLVVNVPGNEIAKGCEMAPYFPPTPYPDGFPYIFLLYEQNEALNTTQIPNMSSILSRPNFSVDKFATEHNLKGPIAGNFMHESYLEAVSQVAKTVSNTVDSVLNILG
ncbi:jg24501 [Pararge aegeria aegeria]|uniref:Jg24501 protein n=1 Tax=Pararge aegeria aegeria TaxID=348720 RepID=A0A8S4RHQ0_9NEOP|nr:jg24501 [Pararge aegeria aegeria]